MPSPVPDSNHLQATDDPAVPDLEQRVFPFLEGETEARELLTDLKPQIEQIADDKFHEHFDFVRDLVFMLDGKVQAFRQQVEQHLADHQAHEDAADWWKHTSTPDKSDHHDGDDGPF